MAWPIATWARLILAVTLVSAVFFVAPIADAATCVPETASAHAMVVEDAGDGDQVDLGAGHGVCTHGHCHHNGTARADVADDIAMQIHARPVHAFPSSDFPSSISPDGLKRPPRVGPDVCAAVRANSCQISGR